VAALTCRMNRLTIVELDESVLGEPIDQALKIGFEH
jgi:hypothetical protein